MALATIPVKPAGQVTISDTFADTDYLLGSVDGNTRRLSGALFGKPYATRAAAIAATIPTTQRRVYLDGYASAGTGAAWYRRSDATETASYPALAWFNSADGAYWLLDEERPYAAMFGALGDLVWSMVLEADDASNFGPSFTSGTNDIAAFQAADAYCTARGVSKFYSDQSHLIEGELSLANQVWAVTDFEQVLWQRFAERENGMVIHASDAGPYGFKHIPQHNTTTKGSDRGHEGNAILFGEGVTTTAQSRITGVGCSALICRAADITGQDSYPSPSIGVIGHVENDVVLNIGTFGDTNSPGSVFAQAHWGAQVSTGDFADLPTETYHINGVKLNFISEITGHTRGLTLSSVFDVEYSDFETDGARTPLTVLVGDNVDDYAVSNHAGKVGQNIRGGFIRGRDCPVPANEEAIDITSRGTSKHATVTTSGGTTALIKQIPLDFKCKGFDIEVTGGNSGTKAVRVFGGHGAIDLGDITETGATLACLDVRYGNGTVTYNVRSATASILGGYGGRDYAIGTSVDKRSDFNSDNSCVEYSGDTTTTTTTAEVAIGATTIPTNGFANDMHIGDEITWSTGKTRAAQFADNTQLSLTVERVQAVIPSGTTITLQRRGGIEKFVATYVGSEFGAEFENTTLCNADFGAVPWTGRNAGVIKGGCNVQLCGSLPVGSSRSSGISDYTFKVEETSHVTMTGVRVPVAPDVLKHFQLVRTGPGGPWGSLTTVGCQIEAVADLATATDSTQLQMFGDVDFTGAPVTNPL